MTSAPAKGAVVEPSMPGDSTAAEAYLSARDAAWLCALPCALVVLLAMLVLGPPLGSLLDAPPRTYRFFHAFAESVHPEPTETGRFLIALSAPLLLSSATVALLRRPPRLAPDTQRAWIAVTQVALVVLLVACVVGQYDARYGELYIGPAFPISWAYFTPATFAVSAGVVLLLALALRSARVRNLTSAALQESWGRRAAATAVAVAMTAIWLLHAVNSDHSIANEPWQVQFHLSFTADEAFAIVNGRTPLVDFSAQYGSLIPWLGALALLAFGKTLLAFTIAMTSLTAIALLAIFGVLRKASRSALAALLLYLPVLATSLFRVRGTPVIRDTFATYFGAFPLRFTGPYVLAWLTAGQLEKPRGRLGTSALFLVAGLVLLNNLEHGIAALAATVAAFLWTSPIDRRLFVRLGVALAAGLAAALALVSLLTLLHAGSLPHLWRLADYARLYAKGGFGMLPIRSPLGLHVAIYLTYVAVTVTATVRAVNRAPNRVLTGMLVWSGVFGLASGSYFVGRSHPETLIASFSTWALALALLVVVVVSRLLADPPRRPSLAALVVLFGLGITICSLAQTPAPWSQVRRLGEPFTPSLGAESERPLLAEQAPSQRRFVSSIADGPGRFVVRRGAPVAILAFMGHRIADIYGLVDVTPYTGWYSMGTEERVEATVDALRAAGGNTMIVPRDADPGIFLVLARHGFKALTRSGGLASFGPHHPARNIALAPWQEVTLTKWVDTRHLHPRALAARG
jgi:hypothetical protein